MCFSQGVFSNLELCTQKLLVFPTAPLVLIFALENSQQSGCNQISTRDRLNSQFQRSQALQREYLLSTFSFCGKLNKTLRYDLTFCLHCNFYCTHHKVYRLYSSVQLLVFHIYPLLFFLSISLLLLDNEAPNKALYKLSVIREKNYICISYKIGPKQR